MYKNGIIWQGPTSHTLYNGCHHVQGHSKLLKFGTLRIQLSILHDSTSKFQDQSLLTISSTSGEYCVKQKNQKEKLQHLFLSGPPDLGKE